MKDKLYVAIDPQGQSMGTFTDREAALQRACDVEGGTVETYVRDPEERYRHIARYEYGHGLIWYIPEGERTKKQRGAVGKLLMKTLGLGGLLE